MLSVDYYVLGVRVGLIFLEWVDVMVIIKIIYFDGVLIVIKIV